MMTNPSPSIVGQLRMKRGCLEIDNNTPYQGSRVLIKNRVSSGLWSSKQEGAVTYVREQRNSAKTRDFLDLAVVNSKSNS